ncbi:unnamed protein product [Linum tenue]|uniref:Alpha/beta hydrolase fold-3 domain-containing protein n=1 Tax=Linum tenue TaxID=586396 RepID=A0AAV0I5J5_9ROSI|nr:unnamed protein product [Linum tenue]
MTHAVTKQHSKKASAAAATIPHVVEDCMGFVQLYNDGTVSRLKDIDFLKFNLPRIRDDAVSYKDCLYDEPHGLHLRIYKPVSDRRDGGGRRKKLPILVYLHGGGFCLGSRDWPNFHNSCQRLASGLDVVVVAPDYRLAPEHRLPAAVDDGEAVMYWLKAQATASCGEGYEEDWLAPEGVDFDRVFVMGDSSGGNIAHQLAVRFGSGSPGLAPVRVRGFVLLAPFFGGVDRTESEEGPREEMLSLEDLDRFWRLALPIGENRDHWLANPLGYLSSSPEAATKVDLDPILLIVGSRELLKDRAKEYAVKLREMGNVAEYVEIEGEQHGFFTNDPYSEVLSTKVIEVVGKFMYKGDY